MRSPRSVVVLMSTGFVMACQTIAGAGAAARPVSSNYSSSAARAAGAQSVATTPASDYAREKDVAAAEMSGSQNKTILIVAIVAAILVAAIVIGSNGHNGSGY